MYFILIFRLVAEDYHWPTAIICSYDESSFLVRIDEGEQFLTYIFSCALNMFSNKGNNFVFRIKENILVRLKVA